jgi:hypothetical protein
MNDMYVVLNTFENNKNAINVKNHEIIHVFREKNYSLKCATQLVHFIMSNGILPLKKPLN